MTGLIEHEQMVQEFLGDLALYAETCLRIRTKAARIQPFTLNAAQRLVQAKLTDQRRREGRVRAVILKARQLGISTLVAGRFYRRCHLMANHRAVVIADKKDRAGMLFGTYERFHNYLPRELQPKTKAAQRTKHLVYESPLSSEIVVETAGDTAAGRGATTQLLHASELAFWPNPEDVWVSMMQAVPDEDTEVIVESTANGVGGLFHDLWLQAEAGDNGFIPVFLPWFIDPTYTIARLQPEELEDITFSTDPYERLAQDEGLPFEGRFVHLTPNQLAWRRRTIRDKLRGSKDAFKQEYPSTAREAFLVSGAGFFDEDRLHAYEGSVVPPVGRGDLLSLSGGIIFRPLPRGPLRIWRWPSRLGRYVIFADVAQGAIQSESRGSFSDPDAERGGRDFSSAHVFDMSTRTYVAALHGRMAPEVFAAELEALGYFYSTSGVGISSTIRTPAYLGVESQGSGETVLHILRRELGYPNLFYHRQVNRRTQEVTANLGWHTNQETRPILLDDFAAAIRGETVTIPDGDLLRECFTFARGRNGKPTAIQGCHDDRVISAAGCLQMVKYAPAPAQELPRNAMNEVFSSPTGLFDYGPAGGDSF